MLAILRTSHTPCRAQVWQSILSQRIDFHAAELEQVSAAARDLLKGLLERDPDARLTPKQALEHPWIKVRPFLRRIPVWTAQPRRSVFSVCLKPGAWIDSQTGRASTQAALCVSCRKATSAELT